MHDRLATGRQVDRVFLFWTPCSLGFSHSSSRRLL
jgi:hypothetical protein